MCVGCHVCFQMKLLFSKWPSEQVMRPREHSECYSGKCRSTFLAKLLTVWAGGISPNQSKKGGKKIFQLILNLSFCHTGMVHPVRTCTFVPQNKYSGAGYPSSITPPLGCAVSMCTTTVLMPIKVFLLHTIIQLHVFKEHPGHVRQIQEIGFPFVNT